VSARLPRRQLAHHRARSHRRGRGRGVRPRSGTRSWPPAPPWHRSANERVALLIPRSPTGSTRLKRPPRCIYSLGGRSPGRLGSANRKHIGADHPERGISPKEVEEILTDPDRVEVYLTDRQAYQVVGRTAAARWLVVIWIDQPEGRYPIHARAASKRIIRRLTT